MIRSPLPRRLVLVLALVTAALAVAPPVATAQSGPGFEPYLQPPQDGPCSELTRRCAEMSDDELYAAAFLTANGSSLGTCYVHDTSTCPGCVCPYYVKLSWEDGDGGFDGGTGCVQSRAEAIAALRMLCASGQCGCPTRIHQDTCILPNAWGKDPITGTCCMYSIPCDVPDGWPWYFTPEECENV